MKPLVSILLALSSLAACTTAPHPPSHEIEPLPGNLAPPVAPRDSNERAASKAYYLGPRGEEWF